MKPKKWLVSVGLAMVLVAAFALPGCPDGDNDNDIIEPEYTLKLQHSWGAGENHFFYHFADTVEDLSDGRIVVEVYSDGEIVDYDAIPDAVASGLVDLGHTHPSFNIEVIEEGYLEYAPYLWEDKEQVRAALWDYGIANVTREAIEEVFDVKVLDFQLDDLGALLFSSNVSSISDMAGMTINLEPPYAEILNELVGISAVYYSPEDLWYNLAMNIIDGLEWGGAICMVDMDLHTAAATGGTSGVGAFIQPYFVISWYPYYCITPSLWEEMGEEFQGILMDAVHANSVYMRNYYEDNDAPAMAIMEAAGIEINYLPEEDIDAIFDELLVWLEEEFKPMTARTEQLYDIVIQALTDFGRI